MTIKLLFTFLILNTIGYSQSPINSFYTLNNTPYLLFSTVSPLNHGAGGANQVWTFNSLLNLGTSITNNLDPTTSETSTYPGTTKVITTTTTEGTTITTGRMFTKNTTNNTFSITGLTSTDLNINFSASDAILGIFPMSYGFSNTDANVAGSYVYTTYSGTFTGNLQTTVDAYGVLNLPGLNFSSAVTRLKTVLTISLNYGVFSNVGTVTQTSYSYYSTSNPMNSPEFRTVNTIAVVPLLSINQNNTSIERYNGVQLTALYPAFETLWIKNPVGNSIEINTSYTIDNTSITISDMLGKTIYQTKNNNITGIFEIPLSLTKGVYLITVSNESGRITKKIIKE